MSHCVNAQGAQAAISRLNEADPEDRLQILAHLCNANGTWDIPEDTTSWRPAMFEIQLCGIAAIADDQDQLPRNWMRAAQSVLDGIAERKAA